MNIISVITMLVASMESVAEGDGAIQVCAGVSYVAVATLVPFTIRLEASPGN